MSTKVEQASSNSQFTMASTSSAASAPSPKVSRFAANSRFVIPKNKLSGSLVPIVRGSKNGASDAAAEEGAKQAQRKTNWGPDLTQDADVRRGRALAYQIRVEQIKQLLNLGALGTGEIDVGESALHVMDDMPSNSKFEKQASKHLEHERREAIGEILKLDPSYKAPADYKPLQKEAKVSIPIKEHPKYDIVSLMFGALNDTQKRLEKETGAKIRVFGTKAGTKEKVEVMTSDGPDMHKAYEELHVHVSSDTYEKIDAAVALIELLVTPVSANPASVSSTTAGEGANASASAEGSPTHVMSQGMAQTTESSPAGQQIALQHDPGRWYPLNATQTQMLPPAGFTGQANTSAPLVSNPHHVSSAPFNSIMPSVFAPPPFISSGLRSAPLNSSPFPSGPQQLQNLLRPYLSQPPPMNHTGTLRNPFMPFTQTVPNQQNTTAPSQLSPNQSIPVGPHPPPMASAGWSQSMLNTSTSISPGNMIPRPPAMVIPHSRSVTPPQNFPPSQPTFSPVNRPISVPPSGSAAHFQLGISVSSQPMPASVSSLLRGNVSTYNAANPFVTTPRPQQPSSSDFTFQTNRPQIPSLQVPQRVYNQPLPAHPNQSIQVQHGSPHPSFNPSLHNINPSPINQGFPRPQVVNQMNHHRPQTPVNLGRSPIAQPGPDRHAIYPNPFLPHMPLRNPRPMQMQQNYPPQEAPRQRFLAPSHQLQNSFSFPSVERPASRSSREQQVYDPFSPTAVPLNPQLSSSRSKTEKQESDPEYEDLMASVGVK